jgi:asparaginyl-tRNA synthetase
MSSTEAVTAATSSPPRVKTADAKVSDEPVSIKGWVKTVRKQKTLAFVEVNDGSNMSGIQCVLTFDEVDEATIAGMSLCVCIYA